jgi:hypothetical protein
MQAETTAKGRQLYRHNKTVFALETIKRRRKNQVMLLLQALDNVMNHPLVMDLIINEKTAVPGGLFADARIKGLGSADTT